jgi:LmbE family N-acetylglucosaminyl deacetylase
MSLPFTATPRLRGALLRCLRLLLGLRSPPLSVPASLLVIAPHPDDECLGCGGLIAATRAGGGRVRVLFLSCGEAAGGTPSPGLGTQRRSEAARAAARLGVSETELHWLGLPDSRLDRLDASERSVLHTRLVGLLDTQPVALAVVSSSLDASSEHQAAARLVAGVLRDLPSPPPLLGYLIWSAWSPRLLLCLLLGSRGVRRLSLERDWLRSKEEALDFHESQLRPGPLKATACLPPGFARALCAQEEFFLLEPVSKSPLAKRSPATQPAPS